MFEGTWVTLGALNDDVNINVAINNDIPQIMPNSQQFRVPYIDPQCVVVMNRYQNTNNLVAK